MTTPQSDYNDFVKTVALSIKEDSDTVTRDSLEYIVNKFLILMEVMYGVDQLGPINPKTVGLIINDIRDEASYL